MKKLTKRFAALGAAVMMLTSVSAVGASAANYGTGSTSRNNNNYKAGITNTYDNLNTILNIGYYYGASASGKSDMLSTYSYNTELGYKYAAIAYGGNTYTSSGSKNTTTAQVSKTLSVNSISSLTYSGYTKADRNDSNERYKMTYTLTLT